MVCLSLLQLHAELPWSRHLNIISAQRPWPVRRRFRLVHSSNQRFLVSNPDLIRSLAVFQSGFLDFSLSVGISSNFSTNSEFLLSPAFLILLLSFCFLRRSGGAILIKTGSHCNRVDFTVPLITLITLCSCVSIFFTCALLHHTWAPYSAALYVSATLRHIMAVKLTQINGWVFKGFHWITFSWLFSPQEPTTSQSKVKLKFQKLCEL
ncbi:Uncharacterized protein FWK35_00015716 [Aphis craccivora]|uniref:Uncharacterized protein n=1 Tax=Aphis craccivora TaxID=307492 RepID=A0A6G0YMR3_APHCR|nr:Uncharacterized protein FWK35_00015716 [Aphis craccivora]